MHRSFHAASALGTLQRVKVSGDCVFGTTSMRFIVLVCIGLAAAYWIDQIYYGGAYSRPVLDMLRHIIVSYK
jgi:hypothetical protein